MRTQWCVRILLTISLFLLAVNGATAQEPLQATISPQNLGIGAFYDGGRVVIKGELPADADAVVRVQGEQQDIHLKQKGKALGLLWMNLGTVTIEHAPTVYLLYAPANFPQSLGANPEAAPAWKLSLSALRERIKILPEDADKNVLFKEFVKLKKTEGLYQVRDDAIRYLNTSGHSKAFEVRVTIPARMLPGQYTVEVYAVKDGKIIAQTQQDLKVQMVGFPAFLSVLAFQHGGMYGLLAIFVALFAGLLTGFLFGGGKGAH